MKKLLLATALVAATSSASAALWQLDTVFTQSGANGAALVLSGNTLFESDGANNLWAVGGGDTIIDNPNFFVLTLTDWAISNTGDSTASSSVCAEGVFGGLVGAHLCNNTSGGVPVGDPITQDLFDGMSPFATAGAIIPPAGTPFVDYMLLGNMVQRTDSGTGAPITGQYDGAVVLFTAVASEVPVPAAAWLFGSALVGLAGIGRKRKVA